MIRYIGKEIANIDYHHGQLRPAVGVESYQVLRANRSHPEMADDSGWTYNVSSMLAYWKGRFYISYISNPASEHIPPGQTFLTSSKDGRHWGKPMAVFPQYLVPEGVYKSDKGHELPSGSYAVMHQRMGFYVAPNGRLLILSFYGICSHPKDFPNDGTGIGRVVREIYADGKFGPIYFIRLNRHAGWNEENTRYPLYTKSPDAGFKQSCEDLLANKLMTMQWWEEDRSQDGFYTVEGYKAPSYYHLPDGRVVAIWKLSHAAVSEDDGKTWSDVVEVPSLVTTNVKFWGQRTSDGRYALIYNPSASGRHRWPLAMLTSDDGINFDNLLLVNGEVPPRRYSGLFKDLGPHYVRGILEGNGIPPDGDIWVTYNMNKEDIWVSRIPVQVRYKVESPVDDTFNGFESGGKISDWNTYSPQWAQVSVAEFPDATDKSLQLQDKDPYDYARAERVFPESTHVTILTKVMPKQTLTGQLYIEVADPKGTVPVWLIFDADGGIKVSYAGNISEIHKYKANKWYEISISLDAVRRRYQLCINTDIVYEDLFFSRAVFSVNRLIFRTGPVRLEPNPYMVTHESSLTSDLPGADEPVECATFYVNYVRTTEHKLIEGTV